MRHLIQSSKKGSGRIGASVVVGALALAALVAGCDTSRLLTVQAPNSVPATVFNDPANATLMVNSAIGDFECAFGGFVTTEGIATDELQDATITAANFQLDRRDDGFTSGSYGTGGCTASEGIYTPMSTARYEADQAINRLNGWTDAQVAGGRQLLLAEANVYAGFAYATMGMAMCQAAFDLGPAVDQKGMFALAEKRFTDAIAAATAANQTTMLNAAYAGRARVRLFQHNLAGAIADAQLVPKGFVFNAANDATTARRFNHVYNTISLGGATTVEVASRSLTTENGDVDPRSATTLLAGVKPADGKSQIVIPNKFNAGTAAAAEAIPQPVARYEEAQLILAEAQGGAQAVTIINTLRTAVSLKAYTGPTDAASITTLIANERQRVLFVEGFRAFDIERFNLALNPAAGTNYRSGGTYAHTVCLPLPDVERFANVNVNGATLVSGVQGQTPLP